MRKRIFSIYAATLLTAAVLLPNYSSAQAPNKMSYQAVLRNNSNVLITNQTVGMRISILQGAANGTPVYVETQTPSSNANGLVSVEIGAGTVVSGTFESIDWANGPFFIQTETDPNGGSAYSISGVSQLLSVPYAMYAVSSGSSVPGPQGEQGPAGPTGPAGSDGATGPQGPIGLTGATGPQGIPGPTGPQGADGATGPQGPIGLTGATGPQGIPGPAGAVGSTGPQGPIGLTGATGPQGIPGPAGADGATGPQGPIGLTGATGPQGIPGPAGADGVTGPQGIPGPTGPAGADGATGPQGPIGLTGATGPQGIPGPTGPAGADGATGPQGENGLDGKTILNGTTVPAIGFGVVGDFYIRTSTNQLYGPKTSGGWGTPLSLVGPQGATGAVGPQGIPGPAGATGSTGATGATGPQGPQGSTGEQGIQGVQGPQGLDGRTILNGNLPPSIGIGVIGDFYIRNSTSQLYGPKTAGGWGLPISLIGPQGPAGNGFTNGTSSGQMIYWNGTAWVVVAPGIANDVLTFVNNTPTWQKPAIPTVGPNDVYNHGTGKVWMDRNLGASQVANSYDDPLAFGYLYQWGRGTDGHQIRTSPTFSVLSSSNSPGHGFFIISNVAPADWRNPQNDNLWQGVNGINNPCPSGYRLPTEAEFNSEVPSWSSPDIIGGFNSPLKLTVGGARIHTTGELVEVTWGIYWTSTINGANIRAFACAEDLAYVFTYPRALGATVRCIKD